MANQTPISGASDAAGGVLINPEYGNTLIDGIRRESAIAAVARVERVGTRQKTYAIYSGRPTVDFVDESGDKPVTGAEFGELTVNIKKIAAIVIYTEEMLEDARQDPRQFVNADVVGAFADKIDAHALGQAAGSNISTSFDAALRSSSTAVEVGTSGDAFAVAVSEGMEDLEAAGYRPSAVIAASDVRAHLRDARAAVETTTPVYTAGYNREPDTLYGLRLEYSSNLDGFPSGANKIAGFVVDGRHLMLVIRKDITVKTSDQATVTVGGTPRNLWQKNELAVLWEMRVGFNVHDIDNTVAKLTNAS